MEDSEGVSETKKTSTFPSSMFCISVQKADSPDAKKGQKFSNPLLDALDFFLPSYRQLN